MADTEISALAQLTGAGSVADADELVIVDKSDTGMAASGTDKRVTAADLATAVFERPLAEFETADPATPGSGARLFSRVVGGRRLPAYVGPSGIDSSLQPFLARNGIAGAFPNGNSTTLTYLRLALTATGTATAANVATSSLHASMKRLDYLVTTAATTAVAGFRSTAAQVFRGATAGIGGFHYVCRWAPATGQATATSRAWCGLRASASAPTDVEPSSNVNAIGMGWDAADSNVQIMHNDGSGTATKVDLGASFPVSTTDRAKVYELALFAVPGTTEVAWQVTDLTTGAIATGTITSADMPSQTTLLAPVAYCSAGGTSSVIGVTLFGLYIETDR